MPHDPRRRGPGPDPGEAAAPWKRDEAGASLGADSPAGGAAARRAVYALPPPTESPAPGATYFRLQGRSAGQVLAGAEVELAAFQMPTGQVGVIRIAEFDINGLLLTSDIVFRVRIDGSIPIGWEWSPFATGAAFFAKEFPPEMTYIRIPETGLAQVTAEVRDAGTYDLGADLVGWHYGAELRDGYESAWMAVLF